MPVPEALATIERYKVPGVVTVSREEVEKKIYLNQGMIHFATSNLDDDRLGEFLLHRGIISQEQYDESARLLKAGIGRQGRILVGMKAVTPKDLYLHIKEQVQSILYSVFSWQEGFLTFQVGLYKQEEIIKLNISIRKTILEGVKKVENARFLVSRMGSKTVLLRPAYKEPVLRGLDLMKEELQLLKMVDGKTSLYNLVMKGPMSPELNAKILYSFFCMRLIEKERDAGIIKVQLKSGSEE